MLRLLYHSGDIYSVSITNDGKYIIPGSYDLTIKIWKMHTGKLVNQKSVVLHDFFQNIENIPATFFPPGKK